MARLVKLKFCVDPELLQSETVLGFIDDATDVETLSDTVLRQSLDKIAEEKKDSITVTELDNIVDKELKMDMSDKSSRARMKTLFINYI